MVRPGEARKLLARRKTEKKRGPPFDPRSKHKGADEDDAAERGGPEETTNSMLVCLRVRPITPKEQMEDPFYDNGEQAIKIVDGRIVMVMDATYQYADPSDVLRANRNREKQYSFHCAFDGSANQQEVYQASVRPVIEGIIDGINATIFAYGATGTGKTHTMIGYADEPGITVLTVADLFDAIEQTKHEKEYRLTMSYMEVYNETIRDLLNPAGEKCLELREDPVRGVCSVGITEVTPTGVEEVMELLQEGNKHRSTEQTDANKTSSRSHAMLQICVEQQDRTAGVSTEVRVSKLSMIDLAGSERASNTNNRGIRMVEGANINRSLLALGNCINALGAAGGDVKFVPYRDSKLTRLLKDSLGGSCRTVMIATLSPCSINYEENINTLKYASRAINIRNKVTRNVIQVSHHISEYTDIIQKLREEVTSLKNELGNATSMPHRSAHGDRAPSRGATDEYENIRDIVFAHYSEKLDLVGSLADLQQDATIAEISNRMEQGPLSNHTLLPNISETIAGRGARDISRETIPSPFEVLGLEEDEKHMRMISDLRQNEQAIEGLKVELPRTIQAPHQLENLKLLTDNKGFEAENLELKRRVQLGLLVQNHTEQYVRLLEDELRKWDRQQAVTSEASQHYDDRAYSPRSQQYSEGRPDKPGDGGVILPLIARERMSRVSSRPTREELNSKWDRRAASRETSISDKRSAKEVKHVMMAALGMDEHSVSGNDGTA